MFSIDSELNSSQLLPARSSAYFCRLEKNRQERNARRTLLIDDQECTDPDLISKEIFKFYSKLYLSSYSSPDADAFFEHVKEWIPRVDECFKNVCEADISMAEVEKAMTCLALDKSQGSGGLTNNFYRHFWDHLKSFFFFFKSILARERNLVNDAPLG